jgi:hypothetical protein
LFTSFPQKKSPAKKEFSWNKLLFYVLSLRSLYTSKADEEGTRSVLFDRPDFAAGNLTWAVNCGAMFLGAPPTLAHCHSSTELSLNTIMG